MKHRAAAESRVVPIQPALVRLLRRHIDRFGVADDGRLFRSGKGNVVAASTYSRVWKAARELALTPAQVASPLAGRPYDLRHAAVSLWLNSGVLATDVAARAGHSVDVLLKVYAKCIDGQEARSISGSRRRWAAWVSSTGAPECLSCSGYSRSVAEDFTIKLTHDQALVLSDWLEKVIGTERFDAIADEDIAVWSALHRISGALETSLVEVFMPDHAARLDAARARLLADLGDHFVQERQVRQDAGHHDNGYKNDHDEAGS